MSAVDKLYDLLPFPLRSVVSGLRGRRLQAFRYGEETDRLVDEAREREYWDPYRWSLHHHEKLERLLRQSVLCVPHYRNLFAQTKLPTGSKSTLKEFPILTREAVRENPTSFLADHIDPARLHRISTSGTTGMPLTLWQSRETVRAWYALFEARWRGWYGLTRHDRWAILGGRLVAPVGQKAPPFWVWNSPMHQLYMSVYHLMPRHAGAYVEAMKQMRVKYLFCYSSAAYALAQFMTEQNIRPPEIVAVITNAEPLFPYQRQKIGQAFECPVYETYGMAEKACGASECLHGSLHLWPDAGVYEVLCAESNESLPSESPGRLVCTALLNHDMPLIRYEVGDVVVLAGADARCACGRTLPILRRVEGRSDDVVVTPDGRRVGRLDPVFKGDLPILEAQIVQESIQQLRVLVVAASGFSLRHSSEIQERLRQRVGAMDISVELHTELARTPNGKLRSVISKVKVQVPGSGRV